MGVILITKELFLQHTDVVDPSLVSIEAAFALKLSQATRYGAIVHRGRGLKKCQKIYK